MGKKPSRHGFNCRSIPSHCDDGWSVMSRKARVNVSRTTRGDRCEKASMSFRRSAAWRR